MAGKLLMFYTESIPLVQAIYAAPELRVLDAKHDKVVVKYMLALFFRMGLNQSKNELAKDIEYLY